MRWTPQEITDATTGRLTGAADTPLTGVAIDTRLLQPGQLFVAVRAERDGHLFIPMAVDAGAGAVLVDHLPGPIGVPAITVDDTGEALLQLGLAARHRLSGPVVGITGSVGKTSTKDLAAAALAAGLLTTASEKSFNNELGVPLTLANAPESAEATVLEMGARGPGHIALLCRCARPTVGVVTAVAAAHTELFGDEEAIAEAKGELVEALPSTGTAVLNEDYSLVSAMAARSEASVVRYSAAGHAHADLVAADIAIDGDLRVRFTALTPWGRAEVRLEARGAHQVGNALAALAVACTCGIDLAAAAAAAGTARLSPWRMEVAHTPTGATVINDAYNANPTSMQAALQALAALPARRRTAVVGVMAELGDRAPAEHRAIADLASSLGVELMAVGTDAYGVTPISLEDAAAALAGIGDGDAVLVKGSRVAGLEVLAENLSRG